MEKNDVQDNYAYWNNEQEQGIQLEQARKLAHKEQDNRQDNIPSALKRLNIAFAAPWNHHHEHHAEKGQRGRQ